MSTALPSIPSRGSAGAGDNATALPGLDKPLSDERLGHSGFHPRGAAAAAQRSQGGSPGSPSPAPAATALAELLAQIDAQLQSSLLEQQQRNQDIVDGLKQAAEGILPPTPSGALRPTVTSGLGSVAGALPAAAGHASGSNSRPTSGTRQRLPSTSVGSQPGSSGASSLGPRWGVSEGGRDHVGWVRSLVRYTETHPIYVPDDRSSEVTTDAAGGIKKAVFPSLKPNRREDVVLLHHWMEEVMGLVRKGTLLGPPGASTTVAAAQQVQQTLQGGLPVAGRPGDGASTPLELADGALHVYGVALEELKRQVSSECRERGDLLSLLVDHMLKVVEARAGLAGEGHLADMQAEYARLMTARDKLQQDIESMEAATVEADKEQRAALASAGAQSRSLALKLVQAQRAAEEVSKQWKVSDMALQNEVERRLETDEALGVAKELLSRTEHEWLQYRAANQRLEGTITSLTSQLEGARRELEEECVAHHTLRAEYEALAGARASEAVDMARIRRDWETDEILVVSLQQQVRDLEAQLAQLKTYNRDQAVKAAETDEEKERLEAVRVQLTADLTEVRAHNADLEERLASTTAQLQDVTAQLQAKQEELASTTSRLEGELAEARTTIAGLDTDVSNLSNQLADSQFKLHAAEAQVVHLTTELDAIKEMMFSVARTLDVQGSDGVPRSQDKCWGMTGPLGGVQRVINVANRQLGSLWERLGLVKNENEVLTSRLENEMKMQTRLQHELYESRTMEAAILRDKEELSMRLDVSEQAKRIVEGEKLRLKALVDELDGRLKLMVDSVEKLQAQVNYLMPFESRCSALEHAKEELEKRLEMTERAFAHAKDDITSLNKTLEYYKTEVDNLLASNSDLLDQVKMLTVVQHEAEDLRQLRTSLEAEVASLSDQLEKALAAYGDALRQLQLAKFFLQGLDLVPPNSPPGSTGTAPPRPGTAGSLTSWGSMGGSRPGTAPARQTVPRARGSATGDGRVDYLAVSPLPLESLDEHRPLSPVATGGSPTRIGNINIPPAMQRSRPSTGSRPLSAVSQVSDVGLDVYGADIPEEVVAMMQARGHGERLASSGTKWMKFKIQMMAYYSNKLREKLKEALERNLELEVEMLKREAEALEDARRREDFIVTELLISLRSQLDRAKHDSVQMLRQVRDMVPDIHRDLARLAGHSTVMGMDLKLQKERAGRIADRAAQTGENMDSHWTTFMQDLPRELPMQPLSHSALSEAIVRIYVRQVPTISSVPVWGSSRSDTVYDAIMAHYTSLQAPGTFDHDFLEDPEGPVGRLFRSCCGHLDQTKFAMFAFFTGLSPDGVCWAKESWHFFLHLLHALKLLLAGTWRSTVKQWASAQGTLLPVQAVYDLIGNLFNVQVPTDLEGAVSLRLASLVVPSSSGPVVDLDALLLLLVNEYNAGNCPRHALLYPRRLTDGQLFNIFNTAGFTPHVDAISGAKAAKLITTSPPTSPRRAAPVLAQGGVSTGGWKPQVPLEQSSGDHNPTAAATLAALAALKANLGGSGARDPGSPKQRSSKSPPRSPPRGAHGMGSRPGTVSLGVVGGPAAMH